MLTREENLVGLMAVNRDLIGQAETTLKTSSSKLNTSTSMATLPLSCFSPIFFHYAVFANRRSYDSRSFGSVIC